MIMPFWLFRPRVALLGMNSEACVARETLYS